MIKPWENEAAFSLPKKKKTFISRARYKKEFLAEVSCRNIVTKLLPIIIFRNPWIRTQLTFYRSRSPVKISRGLSLRNDFIGSPISRNIIADKLSPRSDFPGNSGVFRYRYHDEQVYARARFLPVRGTVVLFFYPRPIPRKQTRARTAAPRMPGTYSPGTADFPIRKIIRPLRGRASASTFDRHSRGDR